MCCNVMLMLCRPVLCPAVLCWCEQSMMHTVMHCSWHSRIGRDIVCLGGASRSTLSEYTVDLLAAPMSVMHCRWHGRVGRCSVCLGGASRSTRAEKHHLCFCVSMVFLRKCRPACTSQAHIASAKCTVPPTVHYTYRMTVSSQPVMKLPQSRAYAGPDICIHVQQQQKRSQQAGGVASSLVILATCTEVLHNAVPSVWPATAAACTDL